MTTRTLLQIPTRMHGLCLGGPSAIIASQPEVARFSTLVRAAGPGGPAKSTNSFMGARPFLREKALCEGRRWDGSALWPASLWVEFSFGPVPEGRLPSMRGTPLPALPRVEALPRPTGDAWVHSHSGGHVPRVMLFPVRVFPGCSGKRLFQAHRLGRLPLLGRGPANRGSVPKNPFI